MAAEMAPEAEASRRLPSDLAPVPQSSTRILPEGVVSSTHDVLPPKWVVPGPGAAMDPRVPQKRASILAIVGSQLSYRHPRFARVGSRKIARAIRNLDGCSHAVGPAIQEVPDNPADGHESLQVRRLAKIERRAQLAHAGPILRRIGRRDDNHGNVAATAALSNVRQDLVARASGQVQIDQEKIGTAYRRVLIHSCDLVQHLFAVVRHRQMIGEFVTP